MASTIDSHRGSVPISKIAGRFLLFDIHVISRLRREHNICGVLIGGIPQVPQQNVFLGLPVVLLPEEAYLLVEQKLAHIVDDTAYHKRLFSTLAGSQKRQYLQSLRDEGRKTQKNAASVAKKRAEHGLAKQALRQASTTQTSEDSTKQSTLSRPLSEYIFDGTLHRDNVSDSASHTSPSVPDHYRITPTVSSFVASSDFQPEDPPNVPRSYPLFAFLHSRGYFSVPGLRFGCDYSVYPGDPLRFHSHFLAVEHNWHEKVPLMDLIGGGRLGTGVKKGYIVGGEVASSSDVVCDNGSNIRSFSIEWGSM